MKPTINEEEIKRFREGKLLVRRIALALCAAGIKTTGQSIYNHLKGLLESKEESVKTFFSVCALSPDMDGHVNRARDYYKGEVSSAGILYEEYEFLKKEFFEELEDSYGIGPDIDSLTNLIYKISEACSKGGILEPVNLIRVKTVLDNNGFPKSERLEIGRAHV